MQIINNLKERQKIALDVLLFFKAFCQENDIHFFLAYGTLLGAVRHKGFIPWDDDVDVMMTRTEYNKLLSNIGKMNHPYYKMISMHNDNRYFAPLAKLYDDRTLLKQEYGQDERVDYGIYIDLFIIDALPDDYNLAEKQYKRAEKERYLWGICTRKLSARSSSWIKHIARVPVALCLKAIGYRHFLKKYEKIAIEYNDKGTSHSGIIIYGEGLKKEYFSNELFNDPSCVTFEGVSFAAPSDVDYYLKQMYGAYMQIPPEEDRKIHPSKAYWK